MSRRHSFLLGLSCLVLFARGSALGASGQGVRPTADIARGWFLVRLAAPIQDTTPDKPPLPLTGRPALDALIAQARVHKIENALPVSSRSPRFPEALRRHGLDRTYKFHVPEGSDILSLVDRFSRLPEVELAEPDYVGEGGSLVPDDPRFPDQWGFDQVSDADVDGPEAWSLAVGSRTVIAVLDTGIDSGHEDFAGKLLPGYDFVNIDSDPSDDHGHGTNVASVTTAASNNGKGIAGACWNCAIMPLKVLDATGFGFYSWWADAMVWATDHGAQVINLSAGGFSTSAILHAGVQYAHDAGVIHVSITHNDNLHLVRYPGNYQEPITVGATDALDQRAAPFCYSADSGSNFGSRTDVVAPGNLILGAGLGGGYNYWCGTSQAAPLVAGLVGIMGSVDPSLGREEARHLLRSGADDQVGRPAEDAPGWDIYHGWGRVNMHRTLQGTAASITLRADGQTSTRLFYETANPLAGSYDFIRGDLRALQESASGVDLGTVLCLEDDSPDPDTAGNEDLDVPPVGEGFFYVGRINAAGRGSYGGSSRHRDREPTGGNCPGCGDHLREASERCDGGDLGGETCQSQGFAAGLLDCRATCDAFVTAGCSACGNGVCEPRGGRVRLLGPTDHFSKGLALTPAPQKVLSISRDDNLLREINISTGSTAGSVTLTLPGATITGGNGLARDPVTGKLFGLLKLGGQVGRELVTIDMATGVCTRIGNTGDNFAAIAFSSSGTLYGVTGDGAMIPEALFTLSTVDATPTFLRSLGGGGAGEALAYNPDDGLLYHASGFGAQNVDEIFQKISPATLSVTNIVLKGDDYSEAAALTYEGSGIFLLSDVNTDLFRIVADGEDCLSCPQDCNGLQTGDPLSLFCCGDGDGVGPVSCQDPRCTGGGKSCD